MINDNYKQAIAYLFFGGLTTIINIVVYYISYYQLSVNNFTSNVVAWIIAVLFAYITNKIYVFQKRSLTPQAILKEVSSYAVCRLSTGILDVSIMYFAIDLMQWNALFWKVFTNILVIIGNFVLSKYWIFK